MDIVTASISPENYLKFQILLKKPIGNFNEGFSELLTNYEKLEKAYVKGGKGN